MCLVASQYSDFSDMIDGDINNYDFKKIFNECINIWKIMTQ